MTSPKKTRRPKCPPGIVLTWRKRLGWGYRAKRKIAGECLWGRMRNAKEDALQDWLDMGKRAALVENIEELLTFDTAMKLMLVETEAVGCRPSTLEQYKEKLRHLWRQFQGTPLHDISRPRIEEYRAMRLVTPTIVKSCRCRNDPTCKHKGRSVNANAATVNKELQVLNRVFQIAIDKDRFPGQNPVSKVRRLKTESREAHHYPHNEVAEILARIRACSTTCRTARQFHDVVSVLFCSGMRVGEFGHLKVEHVDLRRGVLNVPVEGKTGWRAIPMPGGGPLLIVLKRMVEERSPEEYVLGRRPELTVPDLKSNLFRRWRSKMPTHLQRGFHCHTFRHSFVSHLATAEVPEHRIRSLSGHSNRSVSERYLHSNELQLRRDMELAFGQLSADLLGEWGPDAIAAAQ